MRHSTVHALTLLSLATAAFTLGCTDEKIVYRSGSNFPAPPAAAANFIGYYDAAAKQTVCGSCHVDFQTRWVSTKHASAWNHLESSGQMQDLCKACHTTNALGNAATGTTSGYNSTQDARYHDVQCESCHGAGLTHASSPVASNRPLASIKVDVGLQNGCGECHTGTHEPFVDEWKLSGHAKTRETSHNSTEADCQACHTAQGAILAMGSNENYVEKSGPMLDVVCATCHDPHGSANSAQLRFSISAANLENNLCMRCHQRRGEVAQVTTRNSVHSPEGPTLLGTAGWFPPGMSAADSIIGTHGTQSKNPKLCAGCHVQRFTVNDKATGKFVFQSTGHRFLATPCVDVNGQPTVDQSCTESAMTFRSCVGGGCHGSENAARSSMTTAELRAANLIAEANRLITLVKAGPRKAECNFPFPGAYTTCNGISFNANLAGRPGSIIHNPFLVERLLLASIARVKADYGVTVSASINLEPELQRPPRMRAAQGGSR